MFELGQQVVCIRDDIGWPGYDGKMYPGPVKNQIVTIRAIADYKFMGLELGLHFQEFVTMTTPTIEASYAAKFFKPVKKTSIEVFTKMLKPVDEYA